MILNFRNFYHYGLTALLFMDVSSLMSRTVQTVTFKKLLVLKVVEDIFNDICGRNFMGCRQELKLILMEGKARNVL